MKNVFLTEELTRDLRFYFSKAKGAASRARQIDDVFAIDSNNTLQSETFYSYSFIGGIYRRNLHILDASALIPPQSRVAEFYRKIEERGENFLFPTSVVGVEVGDCFPAVTLVTEFNTETRVANFYGKLSNIRIAGRIPYAQADLHFIDKDSLLYRAINLDPEFRHMLESQGAYRLAREYTYCTTISARNDVELRLAGKYDFIKTRCADNFERIGFSAPLRKYDEYRNLVTLRNSIAEGSLESPSKQAVEGEEKISIIAKTHRKIAKKSTFVPRFLETDRQDLSKAFINTSDASVSIDSGDYYGKKGKLTPMSSTEYRWDASEDKMARVKSLISSFRDDPAALGYQLRGDSNASALLMEALPIVCKDYWLTHDIIISRKGDSIYAQVVAFDTNKQERRAPIFKFHVTTKPQDITRFVADNFINMFLKDKGFESGYWQNVKMESSKLSIDSYSTRVPSVSRGR